MRARLHVQGAGKPAGQRQCSALCSTDACRCSRPASSAACDWHAYMSSLSTGATARAAARQRRGAP